MTKNDSKTYSRYLLLLLLLFCFRVAAQVVQVIYPVGFLPPFDTWQSGALPYPVLLTIQIVMIIYMGRLVWYFRKGKVAPQKKRGKRLIVFGIIYFIAMIFRMVAGQTFGADHYWLNAPLPTLFHCVLASYVLCWGHYHHKYGRR